MANTASKLSSPEVATTKPKGQLLLWLLIMIGTFVFAATGLNLDKFRDLFGSFAPFMGTAVLGVFAFVHGRKRYGVKSMLMFLGISFGISLSYESLSIMTGFPFGHYHYSDVLGFKLGLVPLVIMPYYFSVAYLSWTIAHVLLDQLNSRLKDASAFTVPFFSAFIMVLWNLCFDPNASSVNKAWIWKNGGGYFGVPIENFLGWFLCTYTIFQLFAFYLKLRYYPKNEPKNYQSTSEWLMPCVMYGALSLQHFLTVFSKDDILITTLDNRTWWTGDINEALAIVCLFTMIFVTALSITKLLTRKKES